MVYLGWFLPSLKTWKQALCGFPVFHVSVGPANVSFFGWPEVASCRINYFLPQFLCFIAMHRRPGFMFCLLFQTGSKSDMPGCETRWWARGGGSEKKEEVGEWRKEWWALIRESWSEDSDPDPDQGWVMGAQQGKEVRGPGERPPPPPPLAGRIGERQGRIKGLRAPPPRWKTCHVYFSNRVIWKDHPATHPAFSMIL